MATTTKSIVIFGCGYLGTFVARQAANRGYHVTMLTRNPTQAAFLREQNLGRVIEARLDETDWHEEIVPHQDYALNCVSAASPGEQGYRESYLNGQKSILRWASQGHIGTLVYTSSTTVYPHREGEWVGEDDVPAELDEYPPTARVIRESENLLMSHPPSLDRWFVLRLAGLYGPGRHLLLDRLRRGEKSFQGDGSAYLNLVYRDDAADAIWRCLQAPPEVQSAVFNVADGDPAPRAEILAYLAGRLNLPMPQCEGDGLQPASTEIPERAGPMLRRTSAPFPTSENLEATAPSEASREDIDFSEAGIDRRANEEARFAGPPPPPEGDSSPEAESSGNAPPRRRSRRGPLPNRRIKVDRMREWLSWQPAYPSYQAGYDAILAADTIT